MAMFTVSALRVILLVLWSCKFIFNPLIDCKDKLKTIIVIIELMLFSLSSPVCSAANVIISGWLYFTARDI